MLSLAIFYTSKSEVSNAGGKLRLFPVSKIMSARRLWDVFDKYPGRLQDIDSLFICQMSLRRLSQDLPSGRGLYGVFTLSRHLATLF